MVPVFKHLVPLLIFSCLKIEAHSHSFCYSLHHVDGKSSSEYYDFRTSPFLSDSELKAIAPYLLPHDHPMKEALDSIFCLQRASLNEQTFTSAGFEIKFNAPRSFIKVASHPLLPGYLVKVYLDSELRLKQEQPGWKWLARRVKRAEKIRRYIERKGIQHFTVAQKWIYPLPLEPSPPHDPEFLRKNEILLVEDMNLVSRAENRVAWKTVITHEHLDELYAILSQVKGLSCRPDNIAYTHNGKFAFVDTENSNKRTDYHAILPSLSPEMVIYWKKLVTISKIVEDHE